MRAFALGRADIFKFDLNPSKGSFEILTEGLTCLKVFVMYWDLCSNLCLPWTGQSWNLFSALFCHNCCFLLVFLNLPLLSGSFSLGLCSLAAKNLCLSLVGLALRGLCFPVPQWSQEKPVWLWGCVSIFHSFKSCSPSCSSLCTSLFSAFKFLLLSRLYFYLDLI